jgi:DNA-binding transcriptional LysR family regulator
MDRLHAMQIYTAVVENGGFTAASRALRIPLPTVCRKIAELEEHIGAQLLTRSTRKVAVTDTGEQFYEDAQRILENIDAMERQASGEFQHVKGLLSITAPSLFGQKHVLPVINDFIKTHQEIEVRLLFSNQVLDLSEDHIDLGFRIGALSDNSANTRELGQVRQVVCASPSYLAAHNTPKQPKDILDHQCITFSRSGNRVPWTFGASAGKLKHINPRSRLLLNSAESATESALQHCGLTQLYSYQAAPYIAKGELEIVLEEFEISPPPVNLILPHDQRLPQKIKAFSNFAVPMIRESLEGISQLCDAEPE